MADYGNDQAASLRKRSSFTSLQSKKAICCIAVASGKGGVGKTFFSVNMSLALTKLGRKVLLVDADLGLANADIIFGVNPSAFLQDAVFRGKPLKDIVIKTDYGVDLMAASSGSQEIINLGQARMSMFIRDLISFAADYDVLIFDCAAGINDNVTSFLSAAPQSLIIATPEPTSIMDVYALIKISQQHKLTDNIGLIVNNVRSDEEGEKIAKTLNAVCMKHLAKDIELFGIIPHSENVSKAIIARKPLLFSHEYDAAAVRIMKIAKTVIQKQYALTKISELDTDALVKGLLQNV